MDSLMKMFGVGGQKKDTFGQPEFLPGMKKVSWNERKAVNGSGSPIPATEWQDKGKEQLGWIQNENMPTPTQISQGKCMFTTQGKIYCK